MSHTDYVAEAPAGFKIIAHTDVCPVAAIANEEKKLYGVQFHPEVEHTPFGKDMLRNFVLNICDLEPSWSMASFADAMTSVYSSVVTSNAIYFASRSIVIETSSRLVDNDSIDKDVNLCDVLGKVIKVVPGVGIWKNVLKKWKKFIMLLLRLLILTK